MQKYSNMKKIIFSIFITMVVLVGCSKGGDTPSPTPTPTPTPEATIAYGIDIDPGSGNIYAALGASQTINITLSSTVPSAGVTIDVKTTKDADGATISSSSVAATTAKNTLSIDNLQSGVLCTTTITIASKSSASNTLTKSFKIARK